MTVRRIWAGPEVDASGAPSSDGRFLSYVRWKTGDLAVRDLATGERRALTDEGTWMEPDQFAYLSRWSWDNSRLVYAWFDGDHWELRTIRIVEGLSVVQPRVLLPNRNGEAVYIEPRDWSRDGKEILAFLGTGEGTGQIGLVSAGDGSVRVLKSLPWNRPLNMSLSPNGRYVVYDLPTERDSRERDIFLLAADGSRETRLVKHAANDYGPIWTPDGKHVVFASDRTRDVALWALQVAGSKALGRPRLLKRNMGAMLPLGFTRKGSLYYATGLFNRQGDIYIATLDPLTGEAAAPVEKAVRRFQGSNTSPAWSPDGKFLAYLSHDSSLPFNEAPSVLVIRTLATGEEREIEIPIGHRNLLRWSPDGGSILVGTKSNIYQLHLRTGEMKRIVSGGAKIRNHQAAWSSHGERIYYLRALQAPREYSYMVVAYDLKTSREQILYRGFGQLAHGLAVSPDGRRVAFSKPSSITVVPSAGGEPDELLLLQKPEMIPWDVGLAWTPDGRYLIFAKGKQSPDRADVLESNVFELWRLPVAGGEPQPLGLAMNNLRGLSLHPDGRRLAFTVVGERGPTRAVWVLENLFQQPKASD